MIRTKQELPWLRPAPADFNARVKGLTTNPEKAGERIGQLASGALDSNQLARLAAAMEKLRHASVPLDPLESWRLGLVSNATPDFAAAALVATGARYGIAVECIVGGYDQALQEALDPASRVNQSKPRAVLVAIDWRGLPILATPGDSAGEIVEPTIERLRAIRRAIRANSGALCIVQNLAPPDERVFGSFDRAAQGSLIRAIGRINEALAEELRDSGDVLLDVAGLAESVGLERWHSPSQWNMARLPFAQELLPLYADHVCRLISAIRGKSRKCLVLDLDNTLWGGVIGDDGLEGIRLAAGDAAGEAYLEFQRYILSLRARGIVLAVSSKNEEENARLPFRKHPDMLLKEEHFASFRANWNDKPANIHSIAQELSLGLDSMVFVDDNPFERELVRRTLPQVAVPEMPDDPAYYARTLSGAGYFEAIAFSNEDALRAFFYEQNSRRAALQAEATGLESYLKSLDMHIYFRPFDEVGRARIVQLINKSNQFNLTTRRYTEADVMRMQGSPEYFTLQVRLADALGDNGMISVVICRALNGDDWEIDTWLMSCRVLGRRVEQMVLRELLAHAAEQGVARLTGNYIPSGRNRLVENHYAGLGFSKVEQCPDGRSVWQLEVANAQVEQAPMEVHAEGFAVADPLGA